MVSVLKVKITICICLILTGCSQSSIGNVVNDATPNDYSRKFEPLSSGIMRKIKKSAVWQTSGEITSLSLIEYSLKSNSLIVVSDKGGVIIGLDVETGERIFRNVLGFSSFAAMAFDEDGEIVLAATSSNYFTPVDCVLGKYFSGISIWEVQTGKLIECLDESCDEDFDERTTNLGAAMDRNAEFVIEHGEWGYILMGLSSRYPTAVVSLNSPDQAYWWHLGSVAIDAINGRLAMVYEEGRVDLNTIHSNSLLDIELFNVIERGQENQLQTIYSAIFDPTGIWLAVARGGELIIYDVNGWYKHGVYSGQISNFKAMEFNPSGELLFVASGNKISVISLKVKKTIYEIDTHGVTAIDISDDNRLLFWSDNNGAVHVWGILKSD